MRRGAAGLRLGCVLVLVGLLPGCAHLDASDDLLTRWSLRGLGAMGAFALHEACHLAAGRAFGGSVDASWRSAGPYLEFSDLTTKQHRAVSIMGNTCTGLAAELIVDTGRHKKSNLAWGAAAFHAINAFGYAFSREGDAQYWEDSGGTRESWQLINAGHSSRIGAHLAWDSRLGTYLRERWRFGGSPLPKMAGEVDSEALDRAEPPLALIDESHEGEGKTLPPVSLPVSLDLALP